MPVAGTYCTYCGYDNPSTRGACLMCLADLTAAGGGLACPHCGADNARGARFCRSCGQALEPSAVAVPSRQELAERVLEAVGTAGAGVGAAMVGAPTFAQDEFQEPGEEELFGEVEEVAPLPSVLPKEQAPAAKSVMGFLPPEAIPGPIAEEPALEAEEEFAPPPPPGVVTAPEKVSFAPEATGAADLTEEEFAPPPPPGVVPPPPPPPADLEWEEEDFALPPPPGVVPPEEPAAAVPGALELSEEDFAPPPPPGAILSPEEELPPLPEVVPEKTEGPAEEKKQVEPEDDFGSWELDFDQEGG